MIPHLRSKVVSFPPELLAVKKQFLDLLHPGLEILLEPLVAALSLEEGLGVLETPDGESLWRIVLQEHSLHPDNLRHPKNDKSPT